MQTAPSLGDALAWLDRHVNLEAIEAGRAGRAAEPTLARVAALVSAMGDPQQAYPVLHVTGTNGKGSTSRMLASLVRAQGLRTGLYTSPHLESVNERLEVDGRVISDAGLAQVLGAVAEVEDFLATSGRWLVQTEQGDSDAAHVYPTWFELVTAAAFRHFADEVVDAAVVEVGLGGRYDATNVADGAVAVVTNVELDHVAILGETRAAIALEKAGIIKRGAVAVIGEEEPEVRDVLVSEAERAGAAEIWQAGRDFACEGNLLAIGGRLIDLRTPGGMYEEMLLPLHGAYQGDNAACALAAAEAFFGRTLSLDVVSEAFASVQVPGRMEVVGRRPLIVLDGAHNAAGAAAAGRALAEDFAAAGRVVVVMGCLSGRAPTDLLEGLGVSRIAEVVACRPPSPRALSAESVAAAARAIGIVAERADSVADALEIAAGRVGEDDMVLVTGSLYVVGAARRLLRSGGPAV